MKAYHFLKADMRAGSGNEAPWTIGETRTIAEPSKIGLCVYGYHSSPSLWAAFLHAPGPVACLVEISKRLAKDKTKQVSASRTLVKAINIDRELRLYAADSAERVLYLWERKYPRDLRPRVCIETARRFANGQATKEELAKAARAAWSAGAVEDARAARAARSARAAWAARSAGVAGSARAAWAARAAWSAVEGAGTVEDARSARSARAAETKWQQEHFEQMFGGLFR
jgi:hypothetical protein